MTSSRAADGNAASPALNKRRGDFSRQRGRRRAVGPLGATAVWSPSRRAVRTDSDTVSTTPLQVMIHAEAVAVPTKTPTGTVSSRVSVAAAATRVDRRPQVGEPAEQPHDRRAQLQLRAERAEVVGEAGDERPADAHGEGEHGGGGDRAHDRLEEVDETRCR